MKSEPVSTERVEHFEGDLFTSLQENFPEVNWHREHWHDFLASPSCIFLVATKHGEACGYIRAHILPRYDTKGIEILLHEIEVAPAVQRQGIATRLIEHLKLLAQGKKASEIWVVANHSNKATVNLYRKQGGHQPHTDDVVFIYTL